MQLRSAITKCALPSGSWGFNQPVQWSCMTPIARECWAGPHPLPSSCSLCSWQWPSPWIQPLVQVVLVLRSDKTTLFSMQAWAVRWPSWPLPVPWYSFCFKGVSCLLWISFLWFGSLWKWSHCWNRNIPRLKVGCRTSVFREAPTRLDGSWQCLSSLGLLWARGWTKHLQRALLKHEILWQPP